MTALSRKSLLRRYINAKLKKFKLSNEAEISLPVVSSVPGKSASSRIDDYKKHSIEGCPRVIFITKNQKPDSFIWRTTTQKLKEAVRWGAIIPESITGKVIAILGEYRISAHTRIAKGMISNTHALKISLVDLYQQRFEALQRLESLVNRDNSSADYEQAFASYIRKLKEIREQLQAQFADANINAIDASALGQIKSDINEDIECAIEYKKMVAKRKSLRAFNRAGGNDSILEFVKRQMRRNLYEMQGINQDITFSGRRDFAATRGELNSRIEEARNEIDNHKPDLRNAVTSKHHADYGDDDKEVVYDFSEQAISPDREREILLAISFIEGYDKLDLSDPKNPCVQNANGSEPLTIIAATNWRTSRSAKQFFKNFGYILLNMLKSFIVSTRPKDVESWQDDNFHLSAVLMREQSTPNVPLWHKPFGFIALLLSNVVDVFRGIKDFGASISIRLPRVFANDWESTDELPELKDVLNDLDDEIEDINEIEADRLRGLLKDINDKLGTKLACDEEEARSKLEFAQVEYHLSAAEQNDVLTAMASGVKEFSGFFATQFNKDPVGALAFATAYAAGGLAVLAPQYVSFLPAQYLQFSQEIGTAAASSKFSGAVSSACMQAQASSTLWDAAIHGPKSWTATAIEKFCNDPLTVAFYIGTAYALGYVLVNGIDGYEIPYLSDLLREDLGTSPILGTLLFGGKFGVIASELVHSPNKEKTNKELLQRIHEFIRQKQDLYLDLKSQLDRLRLATWLMHNQSSLLKLSAKSRFAIERQINGLFPRDDAKSLQLLLNPEKPRPIAYQLIMIPLSYVPVVLRLIISPFITIAAWLAERPHPAEPLKRSMLDLCSKVARDTTRLIVSAKELVSAAYNLSSSMLKVVPTVIYMAIGRVAGFFGLHTSHAVHKAFAIFANGFQSIGEFFNPVRTLKSVTVAHPVHTINRVQSTYAQLLSKLPPSELDISVPEKPEQMPAQEPFQPLRRRFSTKIRPASVVSLDDDRVDQVASLLRGTI